MNNALKFINNPEIKSLVLDTVKNKPLTVGTILAMFYAIDKFTPIAKYAVEKLFESESHWSIKDIHVDIIPSKNFESCQPA